MPTPDTDHAAPHDQWNLVAPQPWNDAPAHGWAPGAPAQGHGHAYGHGHVPLPVRLAPGQELLPAHYAHYDALQADVYAMLAAQGDLEVAQQPWLQFAEPAAAVATAAAPTVYAGPGAGPGTLSRPSTRRDGVLAIALSLLVLAVVLSGAVALAGGRLNAPKPVTPAPAPAAGATSPAPTAGATSPAPAAAPTTAAPTTDAPTTAAPTTAAPTTAAPSAAPTTG